MKKYILLGFLVMFGLLAVQASAHGHHHGDWNPCYEAVNDECGEPTVSPTEVPSPTISPCVNEEVLKYGDEQEVVCPTETPEASPSAEPTVTQAPPPAPGGDGLSDGRSSCPECTQAPKDVHGEVLSSQVGWK